MLTPTVIHELRLGARRVSTEAGDHSFFSCFLPLSIAQISREGFANDDKDNYENEDLPYARVMPNPSRPTPGTGGGRSARAPSAVAYHIADNGPFPCR